MLTSIYQGGLPHLQISRILLLHHTPLQRKNDNNKNNKQKQTHQHTKVRLCHVLDGRPFPLVLALMRIKCRGFSLECVGGGGEEGQFSGRYRDLRSSAISFFFVSFGFGTRLFLLLGKKCQSFVLEPKGNAINGLKQTHQPFQILEVRN